MGDLQFKSYLRKIISLLEEAENKESKEEMLAYIEKLRRELQKDLQG